jgi:hypothetical protein
VAILHHIGSIPEIAATFATPCLECRYCLIGTDHFSAYHSPGDFLLPGGSRFTGIGAHLNECLLH